MKNIIFTITFILVGFISKAQLKPGEMAPEISLPNAKDSIVQLSSFKGKVVLVDFWASWCGPCRASVPAIKKLYGKYKGQGFEIFGISIDSKKKDWLQAVAQDKTNYTQVYDKNGFYAPSSAAEKYGVNEIPYSFLLDKSGKIIAIDLPRDQLEAKIIELLK